MLQPGKSSAGGAVLRELKRGERDQYVRHMWEVAGMRVGSLSEYVKGIRRKTKGHSEKDEKAVGGRRKAVGEARL